MRLACLSLIACSVAVSAQSVDRAPAHTADALVQQNQTACPVGFNVRHAPQGVVRQTDAALPPGAQEFRISLRPSAHILLYGLSGPQAVPAASAPRTPSRQSEERDLSPQRIGDHFQSTVYTRRLTGLEWVELRSVRYGDGTVWTAPTAGSCRVAPDGFLLVGAAR